MSVIDSAVAPIGVSVNANIVGTPQQDTGEPSNSALVHRPPIETLLEQFGWHNIWTRLCKYDWWKHRKLIKDVFEAKYPSEIKSLCAILQSRAKSVPGKLFWIIKGKTSVTVLHDCAWSNFSCRCRWRRFLTKFPVSVQRGIHNALNIGGITDYFWAQMSKHA